MNNSEQHRRAHGVASSANFQALCRKFRRAVNDKAESKERKSVGIGGYEVLRLKDSLSFNCSNAPDFYEIVYFLRGNAVFDVGDSQYSPKSDTFLLSTSETKGRLICTEDCDGWIVRLSSDFIKMISTKYTDFTLAFSNMNKIGGRVKRLPKKIAARINTLLADTYELQNSEAYGDDAYCQICLTRVLLYLGSSNAPKIQQNTTSKQANMVAVTQYLDAAYSDPSLTVKQVASAHFLSESRLSHLFKTSVGCSVYQYVIKKRLNKAKAMLRNGTPVTEVYAACGFKNYYGFYRAFRNEFGCSPKLYYREK